MKKIQLQIAVAVFLVPLAAMQVSAEQPIHVLVSNDDGIDSPGLAAIAGAIAADPAYRVTVIAPKHQQSVSGHALVTRREVEVTAHEPVAGCPAWSVDATPGTVARIGFTALLVDDPPQLLVSGINRGENDGLGAWTSGTVAVAREGAYAGVPAVAVSLQLNWADPQTDFEAAARWAKPVIDAIREEGLPEGVYLNVNVPIDVNAIRGYRVARMGLDRSDEARYELAREDAEGTRWYVSRWSPPTDPEPGSDSRALNSGWVAITPLGLDQTAEIAFPMLQQLRLPAPQPAETTTP